MNAVRLPLLRSLCLLLPACWWSLTVEAANIVGIVSERSAPEVAAGAHRFLDTYPSHGVTLRTTEQLAGMNDDALRALLQGADAVLLAAVFGEQAARLVRLLGEAPLSPEVAVLATNSDRLVTQLSRLGGRAPLASLDSDGIDRLTANPEAGQDPLAHLQAQQEAFPAQAEWLRGRAYYTGRSPRHIDALLRWLLAQAGHDIAVPDVPPPALLRYYGDGQAHDALSALALEAGPAVAVLDLDSGDRPGDRDLLDAACAALQARGLQCFGVLARWGGASVEAVSTLAERAAPAEVVGVVSLQDFIVGGGDGREAVTAALAELDVPVVKGLRLRDRSERDWRLSLQGVPRDAVHYQLAMPELQGVVAPQVLAVAGTESVDPRTGVRLRLTRPVSERVEGLAERLAAWQRLRAKDNADKRVALVYYNHPPGRHNIGADKLDVPQSLFEILQALHAAGYDTGELPDSAEALHALIQERGVYLPEHRDALEELAGQVPSLAAEAYREYFEILPKTVRAELQHGPVGFLHARLEDSLEAEAGAVGIETLRRGAADLRHMLEGVEHAAAARGQGLLDQFTAAWRARLSGDTPDEDPARLRDALIATGIPGLSGWGAAPGRAMVHDDAMHFPGLRFGNIFVGPQPPRGWELSEALLHANTSFPPTHHYVGFYHWLREHFAADALVYLGRHSTREFLPRRGAGLGADDYPELLGGALPVIYPYIVDGVGEGIQAKRRAMGVMISHLTPPLEATRLYDELLELRQLVESFEAAPDPDSPTRRRAVERLRQRVQELNLVAEIEAELAGGHHHHHGHDDGHERGHDRDHDRDGQRDSEHGHRDDHAHDPGRGEASRHAHGRSEAQADGDASVTLNEVDDALLVHEVGHYVTHMQERFMPLGLHVFGRPWDDQAIDKTLRSMAGDDAPDPRWREDLTQSPAAEMYSLLAALDGRFVPPGQGNDPVRTPAVLPTGRNFHALSSDLVPTPVAWSLGAELAASARADEADAGSEAVVLWASDTVRDEGVMIAFGLDLLGVRPVWNSRGIVTGLERIPLEDGRHRHDVLFTTSGLFRDLYADQLDLLDRGVRMALAGSAGTIRRQHPQLAQALDAALAALPEAEAVTAEEPLAANAVAARWVEDTRALLAEGHAPADAGRDAALRVFGTMPGAYGAGINRLADRSGAWQQREELADVYIRRMGHAYGAGAEGAPAHAAFRARLSAVGRSYLGRASHVYGLLDNDDGFDFQGGLSMAVEQTRGQAPVNRVLQYADPDNARIESLERALLGELRSRNLNPQWLEPLMAQGYAGARTMAADFLDNLWGWQITNPDIVRSWVWDAVHETYFDDRHGLGLDDFLEQGANVHIKAHMQAILLVAAHRGFWDAEAALIDAMAAEFAHIVVRHGLPGSGHTAPDHPTMDWVAQRLDDDALRQAFNAVRDAARHPAEPKAAVPTTIAEIAVHEPRHRTDDRASAASDSVPPAALEGGRVLLPWMLALAALLLLAAGIARGRRS